MRLNGLLWAAVAIGGAYLLRLLWSIAAIAFPLAFHLAAFTLRAVLRARLIGAIMQRVSR
jgi:hypothetical protein